MARNTQPQMFGEGRQDRPSIGELLLRHALLWLSLPVLLLAGFLAHQFWADSPALPLITAAIAVCAGGMAATTWIVSSRYATPGRLHVTGTVALAGLWLLAATVSSPLDSPVAEMLWLPGCAVVGSWNVRLALGQAATLNKQGKNTNTEQKTPSQHGKQLLDSLGVKGAGFTPTEVEPSRVAGELEMDGSSTAEDVQKRGHHLAAALGVPKTGVRITPDESNAGKAELSVALHDVLGSSTPWPGPAHPGGTPFDPIPVGMYETGKIASKVVADEAGAKHEIQQGITGSGKSEGTGVELGELMARRETAIIVIDTVKGIQSFGEAADGLHGLITDVQLGHQIIKRLKHVIKARTDYLGARGYKAWAPGCGLSFLVLQIEEASIFLEDLDPDEIKAVAKAARSAGLALKLSLQRPSHDELDTTARSQFGGVACYGMASDDPVCLLPDAVEDAGADPRQWGDRQPGCLYLSGAGISTAQAATPLRTYVRQGTVMAQAAARYGSQMDPIDAITRKAFGQLWDRIPNPRAHVDAIASDALGDEDTTPTSEGTAPVIEQRDTPADTPADTPDDQQEDDERIQLDAEDMNLQTPDPDPDVPGSIDDEITPLGDVTIQFGQPETTEASPDEARRAVADRIAELEADGSYIISAPDFKDLVTSGMRSRSWFRKELLRLVDVGRLTDEGQGKFGIVPDAEDTDQDLDQAA